MARADLSHHDVPDLVADVMAAFDDAFGIEQLQHFQINRDRIRGVFEAGIRTQVVADMEPHLTELRAILQDGEETLRQSRRRTRLRAAISLVVAVLAVVTATWLLTSLSHPDDALKLGPIDLQAGPGSTRTSVLWLAGVVVIPVLSWGTFAVARHLWTTRGVEALAATVRNSYEVARERIVGEAVTLTINDVYKGTGVLGFPTTAPTLVEMTTTKIVPSASHDYVIDFIKAHGSSAIGVAGPRGSGKSTLLRAVKESFETDGVSIYVAAPVHYSALEFTRRLVGTATRKLLEVHMIVAPSVRRTRRTRGDRMTRGLVLMVLGIAAVGADLLGDLAGLGLVGFAGGVAAVAGIILYSGNLLAALGAERGRGTPPFLLRAADLSEALEWEQEQTQRSTGTFKLGGGVFSIEDEEASLRRRRTHSHPDLVQEFSEILEEHAQAPNAVRVVIVVDELDKLSDRDQLIAMINGLKDLFHIPGVHFLVSVSTDALASFEQRGLPARDAFDSAFDKIIAVERLGIEESIKVVLARASGFPPVLARFCHAWSGGLPRDLLRTARDCVEIQKKRRTQPLQAGEIARTVVIGDLRGAARSQVASIRPDDDAGLQLAEPLAALLDLIARLEGGAVTEPDALREVEGNGGHPSLAPLLALTKIGLGTIRFFGRGVDWQQPDDPGVAEVAEVVATAVASVSLPPPIRDSAVAAALTATTVRPVAP